MDDMALECKSRFRESSSEGIRVLASPPNLENVTHPGTDGVRTFSTNGIGASVALANEITRFLSAEGKFRYAISSSAEFPTPGAGFHDVVAQRENCHEIDLLEAKAQPRTIKAHIAATKVRKRQSRIAGVGCRPCRAQNYACNATTIPCTTCSQTGRTCTFETRPYPNTSDRPQLSRRMTTTPDSSHGAYSQDGTDSYFPYEHSAVSTPLPGLSSMGNDMVSFYTSRFDQYNYQLCAWTNLLALPRRSAIPTILTIPARRGKKANWATFFLPHLSLGSASDSLSVSISAFTALRMEHFKAASELYLRAISLLRSILFQKDAHQMDNLSYLRLWATVLLLAEYEGQLGNQEAQYRHLDGANTLSEGADLRFPRLVRAQTHAASTGSQLTGLQSHADLFDRTSSNGDPSTPSTSSPRNDSFFGTTSANDSPPQSEMTAAAVATRAPISRTERDLPNYLLALNRRLNHSKAIRLSQDTHWPSFYTPADRHSIGVLHEKTSEGYRLIMPLLKRYYHIITTSPPTSLQQHQSILDMFSDQVSVARNFITDYQTTAQEIYGSSSRVYQSVARPGFPFSPVIKFIDPQLAQPSTAPQMFTMFLAPFIGKDEHYQAIRHISGVFAGFQETPGLMLDASFPDIHVAAFYKKGEERDYFMDELYRRGGDFEVLLLRIWNTIDYLETLQGHPLSHGNILGISLREYSVAQGQGLKLKNTRH